MLHLALVFCHFLAASLALGAIVATDLRLLSKLAQDRVRIAPPNAFVTRIVGVSLVILCLSGAALVWQGLAERADYLANPKLQAKIVLVALLTLNAFVLHRFTFPRLARGRRVARWGALDWVAVAVPVAASNALWLFVAFLGVARAWNDAVSLAAVFAAGAIVYLVIQTGVCAILAIAGRPIDPARGRWSDVVRRTLASVGDLGAPPQAAAGTAPRRRHDDPVGDDERGPAFVPSDGRHASASDARRADALPPLRLVATDRRRRETRQRAG
jgi:hypothetical protein